MIQHEQKYLIHLLSSVLHGTQPQSPPENLDWEKVYKLSVWHGVANMVFYSINRLNDDHKLPLEVMRNFQNQYKKGIAKEATQHTAVEEILEIFENNGIVCMPLKGYLTKYLYPCPDMRQMADVDILFKDDQTKQVKKLMLDLDFTFEREGENHDIYYRRPYMNVEMHRRLVAEHSPYSEYLSETWKRAGLKPGCKYTYQLSSADFYIYLLIHLTKHYAAGGTGIRSFMDIWVYNKRYKDEMDWDYIQAELEKVSLREFAENVRVLGEVWFGDAPDNSLYREMTDYVFSSGTYGSRKQAIVSTISAGAEKRSIWTMKQLYRLKLFFPGLKHMKVLYPFLDTLPFLLFICWVLRGIKCLLFKRKHTFQMIKNLQSVSREDMDRIRDLHEKAGLIR